MGEGVYLRENGTEHSTRIGVFDPESTGAGNRMRPVSEGFSSLGIPALQRCAAANTDWVMIDEIGYLEAACPEYQEAIRALMEKKSVLAALRKQELPFLRELLGREDVFALDLDAPFGNSGCVIMASGLGKRFGSNKLMADFRGRPLIASILDATRDIPNRVVVTRHPSVAAYCEDRAIPVVLHDLPLRSDTVRLGLEALPPTDRCLFCPGDQPLLRRETVQALLLLGMQDPLHILRTEADGKPGAPISFPSRFYGELAALPEGRGGSHLAKKYPEQVRYLPVQDCRELMDADTPEDLEFLARK